MNRGGFSKLKRIQEQAIAFFHERGIEQTDDARQSVLYRFAHFWLLVGKSFIRNRCPVRASALAYTTLLALVPLLAVGASIATGLLQSQGTKPIHELIEKLVQNVAPALDLQAAETGGANNRDDVVNKIADYVKNIQSGTLGVTSTIALIFVAIGLLRTIEAAFNDIWGVTNGRGWIASIIQYWATITFGPLILVVVLGLTTGPQFQRLALTFQRSTLSAEEVKDFPGLAGRLARRADPLSSYLAGRLETSLQNDLQVAGTNKVLSADLKRDLLAGLNQIIEGESIYEETRFSTVTLLPELKEQAARKLEGKEAESLNRRLLDTAYPHDLIPRKPAFFEGLFFQLLPFFVLSLAFGVFYQLMPNTHVQWRAALVGGVVGGTLWQLNNKLSVLYVSKAVTYSKIYGSLGIIPLFLIGMYFSWLILLFGAQVAYAFQNRQAYLQEKQAEGVNQRGKEFVALRLMTHIARSFATGGKAPTIPQLAEALGVPSKLVSQILGLLRQERLVVEALDEDNGFVPARPIDTITAQDILRTMRVATGQELTPRDDGLLDRVRGEFSRINGAERDVASNITLATLVKESP